MATYDLEEQEQIEELKTWWKLHGTLITLVILALAIGVVAWQGWQWWQRSQAAQAAQLFGGLQQSLMQQDVKRARLLAGELIDKYSGSAYAGMGALLAARVQVDAGEAKNARVQLAWAADNAKDDALRDIARLRLATLMLDDKAYDDALKQLAAEPVASLAPRFGELRGDVLLAQGKAAEARAAYDGALTKLDAQAKGEDANARAAYRDMLSAKRDAIAGAAK